MGLIPGSGRAPGGRHGNTLQYPGWENPMERGDWWATIHGVAKELNMTEGTNRHHVSVLSILFIHILYIYINIYSSVYIYQSQFIHLHLPPSNHRFAFYICPQCFNDIIQYYNCI